LHTPKDTLELADYELAIPNDDITLTAFVTAMPSATTSIGQDVNRRYSLILTERLQADLKISNRPKAIC
jgi:hypothetical protein